eukprot:GFYU01002668.1.p1 GENE.GFYU01002668.1~~GFYU01002668.1.p1  ORF type:complete len:345 (-),score=79.55 GFYU01002668.1:684-1718(-)
MSTPEWVLEEDWEEWDPATESFMCHMVAGSLAGISEHTAMFPVDTIKTHLQAQPGHKTATQEAALLLRQRGVFGMFRGAGAVVAACVPAHSAYFAIYETAKRKLGADDPSTHTPLASGACGAMATIVHDGIMTPMDVCKQRLQLGYYKGVVDCVRTIIKDEGAGALFRSYPTTLFMNVPYASALVAANESLKTVLNPSGEQNIGAFLLAGAGAGAFAAAVTNPLDVAKTRLQTQNLVGTMEAAPPSAGGSSGIPRGSGIAGSQQSTMPGNHSVKLQYAKVHTTSQRATPQVRYSGLMDAMKQIYQAEGAVGFARGIRPRLLFHAPSTAICWTTYETAKHFINNM